jgi:radical SAM protein with 4Fe4S-binding SPASM domain
VNGSILTNNEIFTIVKEAKLHLGTTEVQLTGGEPTLRPDIFELVNKLLKIDIHVFFQTNGVFEEKILQKILMFEKQNITLIISLDGINTNNYFRGKKSTDITISNIKQLALKIPLRVNSILANRTTWDETEKLALLSKEYSFSLAFNPIVPKGKADKYMLMPRNKFFKWMLKLDGLRQQGVDLRNSFKIVNGKLTELEDCPVRKGNAIHINSDGGVHACGFLVDNQLCYSGSLKDNAITELTDKFPMESRLLSPRCSKCEYYKKKNCNGGCPARVFALHKRFDEVDYYCLADFEDDEAD